jgi:hypothetical protein
VAVFVALALTASTIYFALDARAARRAAARAPAPDGVAGGPDETPGRAAAAPADSAPGELVRLRIENQALKRRAFELGATAGAEPPPAAAPDGGARSWRDRIEEMRKTDPERYKRITERREQRRAEVEASMQEQLALLEQRLERLGDAPANRTEADLVNKIAAITAELAQLGEKWQALAQLPEAERAAQSQALADRSRDLYGQLTTLRAEDRRMQLEQLGTTMGLSPDQSKQMASSVNTIVKNTDTPRGQRPRGPGPAPAPGGGPR